MLLWLSIIAVLMLWPKRPVTIDDFANAFCSAVSDASFQGMRSEVDSNWIHIDDDEDGYVTDRRTGFRLDMGAILDLAKHCNTKATHLPDGFVVEQLCDVVFLVSPDWKIRAIMDEATWKRRGAEILAQVRDELKQASEGKPEKPLHNE